VGVFLPPAVAGGWRYGGEFVKGYGHLLVVEPQSGNIFIKSMIINDYQ